MANRKQRRIPAEERARLGETGYKRALAFAHLGIEPANVPRIPFFRASLTRIGRLLNHPRIKPEPDAR